MNATATPPCPTTTSPAVHLTTPAAASPLLLPGATASTRLSPSVPAAPCAIPPPSATLTRKRPRSPPPSTAARVHPLPSPAAEDDDDSQRPRKRLATGSRARVPRIGHGDPSHVQDDQEAETWSGRATPPLSADDDAVDPLPAANPDVTMADDPPSDPAQLDDPVVVAPIPIRAPPTSPPYALLGTTIATRIPPPRVHVLLASPASLSTSSPAGASSYEAASSTARTTAAAVANPARHSTPGATPVTHLRRPATPSTVKAIASASRRATIPTTTTTPSRRATISTATAIATPARPRTILPAAPTPSPARLATIQRRRTIASFADIEKHTWDVWGMYKDKENVDPRWLQDALRRSRGMSPGVKGKSPATGTGMKAVPTASPARIRRIATAPDLSASPRTVASRAVVPTTRTAVVPRPVPRPGSADSPARLSLSRATEPESHSSPAVSRAVDAPATPIASRLPVPSVCSPAARRTPAATSASISPCTRRSTGRPVSNLPAAVQPPRRPILASPTTKSEAGTGAIPRCRRSLSLTTVAPTAVVTSLML
ncbi:hypothetical protein AMAG_17444 [Allomyces macrogynus ATCC 38327]|uniref:Uncharacterized protein n=1 Tax=Allomyces macrogynus (strain ATCC 38327) TaxID=578462 RepID=A0A0L0TF00_ALLM3|nr:hypothetical protein, variant [Allomyces macrogynus ATCC 38327]KNE73275.1 hypothetical protein AMAG_17444 [Allomyces macrogynus ATCC 38327]|eukprot:KNE73274.1 hypothetical protein, variant [Allomyces macrogynus ATCC 38327]